LIVFQSDEQIAVTPTSYNAQHGSTIRTVTADGADLRELTRAGQPPGGHAAPTWSPDGRYVVFTVFEGGPDEGIWIVRPDTMQVGPLLRRSGVFEVAFAADGSALYAATDWLPRWTADGRRVAYLSRRGSSPGIWAIDVVSRREQQLLTIESDTIRVSEEDLQRSSVAELELAPSTSRVVFSAFPPRSSRRAIYLTPIDRFMPRRLSDDRVSVGYPAWSPDERHIAVEVKDGTSMQAGVLDVQTGALTRLTSERGQTWVRSWSPDGRRVVAAALRDGAWDLRWYDVATARQKVITPPGAANVFVRYPDWSPRGALIVFERGEVRGNIWTLTLR